jgi:alpha-tubulin suppressor-like RCC1 family protein
VTVRWVRLQASCGRGHSVILTDEGVFSMGCNSQGQCGRPIIENEDYRGNGVIHKIQGIDSNVKQVVCGLDHTLFLTEEGHVYSCGWGADGQTGLGHYQSVASPTRVEGEISGEFHDQADNVCGVTRDRGRLSMPCGWPELSGQI